MVPSAWRAGADLASAPPGLLGPGPIWKSRTTSELGQSPTPPNPVTHNYTLQKPLLVMPDIGTEDVIDDLQKSPQRGRYGQRDGPKRVVVSPIIAVVVTAAPRSTKHKIVDIPPMHGMVTHPGRDREALQSHAREGGQFRNHAALQPGCRGAYRQRPNSTKGRELTSRDARATESRLRRVALCGLHRCSSESAPRMACPRREVGHSWQEF